MNLDTIKRRVTALEEAVKATTEEDVKVVVLHPGDEVPQVEGARLVIYVMDDIYDAG